MIAEPWMKKQNSRKFDPSVDESLWRFKTVEAAAGTPNTVFEIEMKKLNEPTQGKVTNIIV